VNKTERLVLRIVPALVKFLECIAADRREGRCDTARRALIIGLKTMDAELQGPIWDQ
jgi:hypothetical protein